MEPIFGFLLYAVLAIIVAATAAKKGRRWWAYLLAVIALGPVVVVLVSRTGGSGSAAAFFAFLVPISAFITALLSDAAPEKAAQTGAYGDYVKCPYCAEAVRREAIKCKHCGSELTQAPPTHT